MYETELVKKRKRKIAAAIGTGASATVIGALSLVAFLGRFVGTFTVNLNTGDLKLSLSERDDFLTQSSFLQVDAIPAFEEYTYHLIIRDEDQLDSQTTDYTYGANYDPETEKIDTLNFFKYTFYVKNVGSTEARYKLAINILDSHPSNDGRYLNDTLRVMLYENDADSIEHKKSVYAKKSASVIEDNEGNATFNELIDSSHPEYGYAEKFESMVDTDVTGTIATFSVENFEKDDVKRYTIVTWLEGNDPQSDERLGVPMGATVKLGVEINAYENQ